MPDRTRAAYPARRFHQLGWTLNQLMFTIIISTVLAAYAAKAMMDAVFEDASVANAAYFSTLRAAMEDYTTNRVSEISNNTAVAGFANPLAPTLAELKAAGHLANAFPTISPLRQTVTLMVTRSAACPNPGCLITSYGYGTTPVNITGANNLYLVSVFLAKMGGYGIASTALSPGTLSGPQCDPITNPQGTTLNVIGMCSVVNAGFWSQFVRRGDDRTTTLNNSLTVNGTVTATVMTATGNITSISGNVGAGQGTGGCSLAEMTSLGQIVTKSIDCIVRGRLDVDSNGGGRLALWNSSGRNTVTVRAQNSTVQTTNAAGATTLYLDGQNARVTTGGLSGTAVPSGWTQVDVNTRSLTSRGQIGAWDGTTVRARVGNDGQVEARDASGAATAVLDGTNGRASANTLRATDTGVVGAACTTAGDQRQRSGASGAYVVCQGGVWVPMGPLVVTAGTACTTAGEAAIDTTGQSLVCKTVGGSGVWIEAKYLFSDFVFMASSAVSDGSVVPKPTCATVGATTGVPLIFILGQTEASPDGAFNRYAVDSGTSWTIHLKRGDDSTALAGASALAHQFCYYSSI